MKVSSDITKNMSRAEEDEPVDRRLLLSLQHIQERNILMNQALFRQRLAQEDSIKEEEEDEDEEERDDEEEEEEEGERNNNCKGGAGLYVNGRGSWSSSHTPSSSSEKGSSRLAFSVENILAPGRFCRPGEEEGDQDNLGKGLVTLTVKYLLLIFVHCINRKIPSVNYISRPLAYTAKSN